MRCKGASIIISKDLQPLVRWAALKDSGRAQREERMMQVFVD
jgi:hypothetical protein